MSIESDNKAKYLKPPTFEEIEFFRKSLGVRIAKFERFYGLSRGCIRKIGNGERNLPVDKWHIIYENIKPAYGVGFLHKPKRIRKKAATKAAIGKPEQHSQALLDKLNMLK